MADHIPFLNTSKDLELFQLMYADSEIVRVSLEILTTGKVAPANVKLWIDPGIDGFCWESPSDRWSDYIKSFTKPAEFKSQLAEPKRAVVDGFVHAILDACNGQNPAWITVPQLPYSNDSSRNRINKTLAEATESWRRQRGFSGLLILPVILTNQEQYRNRTARKPRIDLASTCFQRSGADGYWIVDRDLGDQSGTSTFESKRFPAFISFCEEMATAIPRAKTSVAGPFWGLNLVLWTRGIIKHPAIGMGSAYQYQLSGGRPNQAAARVALEPLRRWVRVSGPLKTWLADASSAVSQDPIARQSFSSLLTNFERYLLPDRGRRQIAKFYKEWFDSLASVPAKGRALALYQDLSAAYVLGKSLDDLPKTEKSARRPDRIARQLMVNCL